MKNQKDAGARATSNEVVAPTAQASRRKIVIDEILSISRSPHPKSAFNQAPGPPMICSSCSCSGNCVADK